MNALISDRYVLKIFTIYNFILKNVPQQQTLNYH